MLRDELGRDGYRVIPDSLVDIEQQMHESALAVFLLSGEYDSRIFQLTEAIAARPERIWALWTSPAAEATRDQNQRLLLARLKQRQLQGKRDFGSGIRPDQLKQEILNLLRPSTRALPAYTGKQRVALVYDDRTNQELLNAGEIRFKWAREFDFDLPNDGLPPKAAGADGVLLVWGAAAENWCSDQFERLNSARVMKALCVFDPDKREVVDQIRRSLGREWHITEHYGNLDPGRLDSFFEMLRQRKAGAV
jgi:hypothetical protein